MDIMSGQLFLFAIAMSAAISEAIPGASWDRSMNREPHDRMTTVTLRCIVTERMRVDPIYIKVIVNDTEHTIVKNNNLESGYDSERYRLWDKMEYHQDSDVWVMELNIRELSADDSGYYRCVLGNKASSDSYQLKVKVPVTDVYFTKIYKDGTEERIHERNVVLKSNESGGIACHAVVTSGIVKPIIQMTKTGNLSFEIISSSVPHEIFSGRFRYRTSKQMRFKTWRPDHSHNGAELRCEGWTSGFRAQKKIASVTLRVEFPPIFECNQTTLYGDVGDTASVSCNVSANPDCRYLELAWGAVGTEHVVTESSSAVVSTGNHLSTQKSDIINKRIVNIAITALKKQHYSQKYFLRCNNVYGNAEQQLKVLEGKAPLALSVGTTHLWSASLLMGVLLTYLL